MFDLGALDDQYSAAIRGTVDTDKLSKGDMLEAFKAGPAAYLGVDRNAPEDKIHPVMKNTLVGARYALPAAGVTAAGAGLVALSNEFGSIADQGDPNALDPGAVAGYAALGAGVAAAPAIFNEVRQKSYRAPRAGAGTMAGTILAGAGGGALTSLIIQALGNS